MSAQEAVGDAKTWQAVFVDWRFLVLLGAEVARSKESVTCNFVARSSVLTIGFPVSLEARSMPTRGAGRR